MCHCGIEPCGSVQRRHASCFASLLSSLTVMRENTVFVAQTSLWLIAMLCFVCFCCDKQFGSNVEIVRAERAF